MILALLTPLIQVLLVHIPAVLLTLLLALWLINSGSNGSVSALFFVLGAYIGINQHSLFSIYKYAKWMWPIYLSIITFNSAFPDAQTLAYLHKSVFSWAYLHFSIYQSWF